MKLKSSNLFKILNNMCKSNEVICCFITIIGFILMILSIIGIIIAGNTPYDPYNALNIISIFTLISISILCFIGCNEMK